jgi:enamine deaminase RidA (YjgF/YER057c/UK114 family)
VKIDVRKINSDEAAELYITASVTPNIALEKQANELFGGIRQALDSEGARIFQERVFGTDGALQIAQSVRADVYGGYDDGVEPAWLLVPQGSTGKLAGAQVHALSNKEAPKILRCGTTPCGRLVHIGNSDYLAISCIRATEAGQATEQAKAMLKKAEAVLKQAGADMHSVPRTWMWLSDILSWYDKFNKTRNRFFTKRGLIGNNTANRMPASTGIGIGPRNGAFCGMDVVAVVGPDKPIGYFDAGGNQNSALKYGSAFSRACCVETPAGMTLFVSGTASIGINGKTTNIGDAPKQIEESIKNVRAVLREMQCDDNDVVQATAYCKTTEIEKLFRSEYGDLAWPNLTAIADICRDDLLFEVEATAIVAK